MSAVVGIHAVSPPALPLLADADVSRVLAWQNGKAVTAGQFLAEVNALAARLPSARHVVNLCDDRYRFIVSFCAAAVAGQSNLLPGTRTPQAIAETLDAYPDSYVLAERALDPTPARQFLLPQSLRG
ncbi:MAG TPA: AMP-ligase, partial [Rudaea sp.]|nr:AMP-ligase [Rudaea sp.]